MHTLTPQSKLQCCRRSIEISCRDLKKALQELEQLSQADVEMPRDERWLILEAIWSVQEQILHTETKLLEHPLLSPQPTEVSSRT
jgi:hypothetical protein